MTQELFIGTSVMRAGVELDVCIYFEVESYPTCSPDCRDPCESPNFEFTILRIELDGVAGADTSMTPAEIATATAWFKENHSEAECVAVYEEAGLEEEEYCDD